MATLTWSMYFASLRTIKGRRHISTHDLMALRERQGGRCALTGLMMTSDRTKGKRHWTNASLDRINPGEPYAIENIQLVCAAVNMWRGHLPTHEFISWCRLVAYHNPEE